MRMISKEHLVRLLMISDNPCLGGRTKQTLTDICTQLDVQAAMLHLTDGSAILLKDDVNVPGAAKLGLTMVPKGVGTARCAMEGTTVVETGFNCSLQCPSGAALEAAGFRSHACTPLMIRSESIGALSALAKTPRDFTKAQVELMIAKGRRLVLELHHMIYFPDLASEWLELEHNDERPQVQFELRPREPLGEREQARSSIIDRVLALENLSRELVPSALAQSLPKGINWPTLRRVCEYIEQRHSSLSRKDLAEALGFSEVTAGNYLTYLADAGILEKEVSYGQVGRPAFIYRLPEVPQSSELSADYAALQTPDVDNEIPSGD